MKKLLLLLCFLSFISSFAADIITVSGKGTCIAPESVSREEMKRIALDKAKIDALEAAFGTVVSQSTTSIIHNENENTNSNFSGFLGTLIKGEWIETIGEPKFDYYDQDGIQYMECFVKGHAREKATSNFTIDVFPIRNLPEKKYRSTTFFDGDEMYLYLKSPVSGFLNVYLVSYDEDTVYCLLPYKGTDGTSFKIDADREYILFSKQKNIDKTQKVNEYTLSTSKNLEFNDIIVIYSQFNFFKANMEAKIEREIPNGISINKFNKYLTKLCSSNDDIFIIPITLTIKTNETDI